LHYPLCMPPVPCCHVLVISPLARSCRAGPDVFISHAGPDKRLAEQLHNMLQEQLGLTVFLDKYMRPGDPGDEIMLGAANGAHVGLTLFSPQFAERPWPLHELKIFAGRGSLLPALVPGLKYEAWKECLDKADVSKDVRTKALRTVMMIGSDQELLAWQHKVCLDVVRALVAKVRRPDLPDRAWAGVLKLRVKAAAERVAKFTTLTVGEVGVLKAEAAPLAATPPTRA
jgi:hypothetical protein